MHCIVIVGGGAGLADRRVLPAESIVWAPGVKARDFPIGIATRETHRIGRLVVRPTLQTTRDDDIFAFAASPVWLGEDGTVGSMMGRPIGSGLMTKGRFARMMYLSLYNMHEDALHGFTKAVMDTLARRIVRRNALHVKLH